jgi:hypothetical protein
MQNYFDPPSNRTRSNRQFAVRPFAPSPLGTWVELGEILPNDHANEMEKINQVRSILFGVPIDQLPK